MDFYKLLWLVGLLSWVFKYFRRGDCVYHNWGYTSIYRPFSYPFRSLLISLRQETNCGFERFIFTFVFLKQSFSTIRFVFVCLFLRPWRIALILVLCMLELYYWFQTVDGDYLILVLCIFLKLYYWFQTVSIYLSIYLPSWKQIHVCLS